MQSSRVQHGPNSTGWCPYKKTHRDKAVWPEGCGQSHGAPRAPAAGRGRKVPPLEPLEGAWPCQHLDPRLPVSRAERG